jgi:hypothetical protein
MAQPIKPFSPDQTRTPMSAEAMNEIITRINAFLKIKIVPDGMGTFKWGDDCGVMDLDGVNKLIEKTVKEIITTQQTQIITELVTKIIEERLKAIRGSGRCLADGSIEITITA